MRQPVFELYQFLPEDLVAHIRYDIWRGLIAARSYLV